MVVVSGFKTLSSTSMYFKCLHTVTSVVSTPVPGNTGSHYHVHVLLLSRGSKSATFTTLDSELLGNHLPLRWGMSSAHLLDWETSRNASAIATASLSLWSWIDSCLLGTETRQKHAKAPRCANWWKSPANAQRKWEIFAFKETCDS